MGRVYLARQLDLGREVVVKVMHDHIATDPKFCDRFQRETLLMARFHHPGAVTLYDASLSDPNGPCIVMEYVRGVNLETLLARNGRMNAPRVGRALMVALAHLAHDKAGRLRAALALSQIDQACYFLAVRRWQEEPEAGVEAMAAQLCHFLTTEAERGSGQ